MTTSEQNRAPRIALIPGDGIGAEVVAAAVKVANHGTGLDGVRPEWTTFDWGTEYYLAHGRTMSRTGLTELRSFDAILLGAVGDKRVPDRITLHELVFAIRKGFDQYVNIRPARLFDGVTSPLGARVPKIDLIVVRENTEGEYANVGGRFQGPDGEAAIQSNVFTRKGCERVIRRAFDLARERSGRVTSITKSNAQLYSMTLWDDVFNEVALEYRDVSSDAMLVDAAAMELVRRPERFDVMVASNLFGDILSDISSAIVGGLGMTPSGNINPDRTAPSMFEPVHGSAPDIAGQGVANPIAAILSAAMLLSHIGHHHAAARIEAGVRAVLSAGKTRTPDIGGASTTDKVAEAVIRAIGG